MNTLGNARLVGNFESNSPEWHALRLAGIGGSDVAGIVGVSPWNSPFKVWAVKTERLDDSFVPSEAAEWGTRLESVIMDKFIEDHPNLNVVPSPGTFVNIERPWQIANPDGIYTAPDGSKGIIEIKTARYEDDWANGVPVYYQTQVQWYANAFGFTGTIYVVALFSGSKYRVFEIEPDPFAQSVYLSEVEKFLEYVRTDQHPEFDGSMATLDTIRELHPDIDPDGETELGDLGVHFMNAVAEYEEKQKHLNEMKSRVLDAMGDAKRGLIDDRWAVTRQSRAGGTPFLVTKKV